MYKTKQTDLSFRYDVQRNVNNHLLVSVNQESQHMNVKRQQNQQESSVCYQKQQYQNQTLSTSFQFPIYLQKSQSDKLDCLHSTQQKKQAQQEMLKKYQSLPKFANLIGFIIAIISFYLFFRIAAAQYSRWRGQISRQIFNQINNNSLFQINLIFWTGLAIVISCFTILKLVHMSRQAKPNRNYQIQYKSNILPKNKKITQAIEQFNQRSQYKIFFKSIASYICMIIVAQLLITQLIQTAGYSKKFHQFSTLEQFNVVYIWQNQVPQQYKQKLQNIYNYEFRVVRNCTMLLNKHLQQSIKQNIYNEIANQVNLRTDMCRLAYLYEYGGLYLDMDTQLDYSCMKKFVKNIISPSIFFQATPQGTIGLFAIYSPQAKNPYLKLALDNFMSLSSFNHYYTLSLRTNIPEQYRVVKDSKCIKKNWKKI